MSERLRADGEHATREWLSLRQATQRIPVSVKTLHRLRRRGLLRMYPVVGTNKLVVRAEDVDALVGPALDAVPTKRTERETAALRVVGRK